MDIQAYLTAPIPRWVGLIAVISTAVAGTGLTYLTTRRYYEREMDQRVADEVVKTNKFFDSYGEGKKNMTPAEAVEALIENPTVESVEVMMVNEGYKPDEADEMTEVAHNVFTDAKDYEFDLEEEMKKRSPERPYIITEAEFFESEYQTVTLTWYDGDEVLADEKDEHIPEFDSIVGEDNLLRFGAGSGDKNVLYIRNERLEVDMEILKNDGKYVEQVHGFIQHEDRQGPRKFRTYDD